MLMMPLSAMRDRVRGTGVRRCSFSVSPTVQTMVMWRVSLSTCLVKNLQYVLSTVELFVFSSYFVGGSIVLDGLSAYEVQKPYNCYRPLPSAL